MSATTPAGSLTPFSANIKEVHWRYDPATPRGPEMSIRPRPEQIIGWAAQAGWLELAGEVIDLPRWHYGMRFRRKAETAGLQIPSGASGMS